MPWRDAVANGAVVNRTIVVTHETFASVQDEWSALLPDAVTPFPFQSPEWEAAWWDVFGGDSQLLLLAARDETGALVGVAPLMIAPTNLGRTVQFIGGVDLTDYLDIVAREHDLSPVWRAVGDLLWVERDQWDALDFHCLPQWSPSQAALADILADALPLRIVQEEVCPILRLDGSFDTYLRSLPKKERHEIKRKARNFERDAPTGHLRVLTKRDDVLAAMPDFFRLHRLSAPDKERFWTPDVERFFLQTTAVMADRDWLRLYVLDIDGAPVAAMYTLCTEGRLLVYNSGFDPVFARVSVGMVLTAMIIEDAAANGLAICDLLRGNESYKYRFGAVDTPIWRVVASDDRAALDAEIARMEAALGMPADDRDLTEDERNMTEGAQ